MRCGETAGTGNKPKKSTERHAVSAVFGHRFLHAFTHDKHLYQAADDIAENKGPQCHPKEAETVYRRFMPGMPEYAKLPILNGLLDISNCPQLVNEAMCFDKRGLRHSPVIGDSGNYRLAKAIFHLITYLNCQYRGRASRGQRD